jgi:membrane fusion protein, multidrug efflux system
MVISITIPEHKRMSTKAKKAAIAIGSLGLLAIAGLIWHLMDSGIFGMTTGDAYVQSDMIALAPKVAGYISEVDVKDNQAVHKGDVLFRVDDRDYRAKYQQAQAGVAAATAAIANLDATRELQNSLIEQAKAGHRSAVATSERANRDYKRMASLWRNNAISDTAYDQARASNVELKASEDAAAAALQSERRKIDVISSQREAAVAALSQALSVRELAKIDLDNTVIRSPIDGIVGNRQIRAGKYVTIGTPQLTVVPVKDVYVVANFKETQVRHLHIGQPVRIAVDGYPHAPIFGKIDSLAPGSGAAFSLFPPDNATGNYIRIVQRVPVKIRLTNNPLASRLVPGLSVSVSVEPVAGRP